MTTTLYDDPEVIAALVTGDRIEQATDVVRDVVLTTLVHEDAIAAALRALNKAETTLLKELEAAAAEDRMPTLPRWRGTHWDVPGSIIDASRAYQLGYHDAENGQRYQVTHQTTVDACSCGFFYQTDNASPFNETRTCEHRMAVRIMVNVL